MIAVFGHFGIDTRVGVLEDHILDRALESRLWTIISTAQGVDEVC